MSAILAKYFKSLDGNKNFDVIFIRSVIWWNIKFLSYPNGWSSKGKLIKIQIVV